jgi:membrane associated rhomboid family serine protease
MAPRLRRSFETGLRELPRCPVVLSTGVLAIGATLSAWRGGGWGSRLSGAPADPGESWKYLSSILPHVGILHLVFNLWWLVELGPLVENSFGSLRTLGLFLLLAAGSSAWQVSLEGPGVGLSGVVYGLWGLLWMLDRRDLRFLGAVDRRTTEIFVGWFFLCCVLTWTGVWRVGNTAHATGAILGGLAGAAISAKAGRRAAWAGLAGLALAGGLAAGLLLPPALLSPADRGRILSGWAYRSVQEGDWAGAEARYREALDRLPDDAPLRYAHGWVLEKLGRWEEAREEYRDASRLAPSNEVYRKAAARER